MDESILTSIKKLLGITEEYEHFDQDVVIYINNVFAILKQLGVGPEKGFSIKDNTTKWKDYISDESMVNLIKPYMYGKVRMVFDPPQSSAVMTALEQVSKEQEWRIHEQAELGGVL